MTRYGMLINTKKCVGCSACRIACQMKNHLDPEESFIKYHEIETGEYPQRVQRDRPHPVHALRGRALRCRVSDACHLHHRFRRGAGGRGKVHRLQVLHGCVSLRRRIVQEKTGVVEKCRFCWDGEKPGNPPACVGTCISGARIFGDLDDPDSEINQAIAKYHAQPLADNLTVSKIYYVR